MRLWVASALLRQRSAARADNGKPARSTSQSVDGLARAAGGAILLRKPTKDPARCAMRESARIVYRKLVHLRQPTRPFSLSPDLFPGPLVHVPRLGRLAPLMDPDESERLHAGEVLHRGLDLLLDAQQVLAHVFCRLHGGTSVRVASEVLDETSDAPW